MQQYGKTTYCGITAHWRLGQPRTAISLVFVINEYQHIHQSPSLTFVHLPVSTFYRAMQLLRELVAKRGYATVSRLSVCPSVTFRYVFHTGWHASKIISRPNSLRYMLTLTLTWAIWSNGNTPKIRMECGWVGSLMSTKTCNISDAVT